MFYSEFEAYNAAVSTLFFSHLACGMIVFQTHKLGKCLIIPISSAHSGSQVLYIAHCFGSGLKYEILFLYERIWEKPSDVKNPHRPKIAIKKLMCHFMSATDTMICK